MRKLIFTVLGLACGMLYASAAVQYMTIEKKNGAKYSFLLKENPVITYQDGNIVINGNEKTSYSIEEVKNYHFTENNQSAVDNTNAQILRIVSVSEDVIRVENALTDASIKLVNINGAIVGQTKADNEGSANVSLPSQKGVYILLVGNKSFKLIRK
ncbi:MAG: T9SS type A sorting domain-containing protein [Bacteroidales bacterium]|jgi:hypothetical protein|nr:T9SS type A sorting domain-containing protein [Bacteroidales bacterium]